MRLRYFIWLSILFVGCEGALTSVPGFTGTWNVKISMLDEGQEINEMEGTIIFYADNTAKLHLNDESLSDEVEYLWYQQNGHLLLVNQQTDFTLPYEIEMLSSTSIGLKQGEDVKMILSR